MTGLATATLRERGGAVAGTFVALFCGCGLLLVTGLSGTVVPERYAAAPVLVTGDQDVHEVQTGSKGRVKVKDKPITDRAWLPAATATRLAGLPGVGEVVTEVEFAAYLPGGRTGESWGHGWESAALGGFSLAAGRAPRAADEVVLDAATAAALRLGVGSGIDVLTASGTLRCRVAGITAQGLADETAVFFATDRARALAGHPGLVSAIGVFPAQGTDPAAVAAEVRAAAASPSAASPVAPGAAAIPGTAFAPASVATVHTGEDRGAVEFVDVETARTRLISIGAVLAGMSLLVSLLVVTGTCALSLQQRAREIAVLRAVAATPRQISRLIGAETLLVGLPASVLGAVAGLPLGAVLYARFTALGVAPRNLHPVVTAFPPFVAAVSALAAAWTAARISARRANRIRPTEALSEAELTPPRISWVRAAFGVLAASGALTLTLVLTVLSSDAASAPVSIVATLLWCAALSLLGPPAARATTAVLRPFVARASRIGGFLAAANLRAAAGRLASVIMPLTLLISMACVILFTHTTVDRAAREQSAQATKATYVLGPKVPADAVAAVEAVPGVRAVTEVLHVTVRDGVTDRQVLAATPGDLSLTLDLGVRQGSVADLSPSTMAVASGLGYRLGDRVQIALPDGTLVALRVVALYDRGLGEGDFVLDHDLVAGHVDVPLDDEVLVAAGAGVTRAELTQALRAEPEVSVADRADARAEAAARTSVGTEVGYVSLGLIVVFTAIAVCNTLAMAVSRRGAELRGLRLVGATRKQVLSVLRWETCVTVLIAATFGSAVAAGVLTTYATGMTGSSSPCVPVTGYLAVIGTAAVLATLATWLPARIALGRRTRPVLGGRR